MSETYTRTGDTKFEMVYETPDDADDDYTVWLEAVDADEKVGVPLAEFEAEFEVYDENEHATTDAYLRERARNGHGIQ